MEAALIICTHTPRAVERRLADLQTLAEFRVRLFEVEVEAKGQGDASTVKRVTERLHDEFPAQLLQWPYGKLPTGNAIQELLAGGSLADLIGEDDILPPTATERIAEFLATA